MKLTKLICADICRDGGSFGASFETNDGGIYEIWLPRSGRGFAAGPYYRWLFVWFATKGNQGPGPDDVLPVVTGSDDDRVFFEHLKNYLDAPHFEDEASHLKRLKELLYYAERRGPCFPGDLAWWKMHIEKVRQ